ncbi:hypothetical protein [Caproiciproducens sp.]
MANCEYRYPALTVERKHGDECFLNGGCSAHLVDFWRWAYSDLMGNTERGKLAEYIVSLAMHCADGVSKGWRAFDVLSPEGIKIEVKTSAYLQSWAQKKISDIRFSVRETLAWDSATNAYAEIAMRQADVYVFCVENCKEQKAVNPLDLAQWDFYPIATGILDTAVSNQKSIGLNALLALGAKKCSFAKLRDIVIALAEAPIARKSETK